MSDLTFTICFRKLLKLTLHHDVCHLPEIGRAAPPGCGPVPASGLLAGDGARQQCGTAAQDSRLAPDLAPQPSVVLPANERADAGGGELQQGELARA